MLAITVTPENSSPLLSTKLLKPEVRLEDAACVARAIAQLMDPEWREFVDQEQHKRCGRAARMPRRRTP
jgi:transcription initiation factor TFIIIB Brf1 subunit/transcription initiation factor TFIIB